MATNVSFSPKTGFATIARSLSRVSGTQVDDETLKVIVVFFGLGLVVALLFATGDLDISIGVF